MKLDTDEELTAAIVAFEVVLRENVLVNELQFGSSDVMERVELGGKTIGINIS
ncbi:hypothetical protein JCM10914_321 [Paenibacillus sp. JCM 10914]|nr:hypothetical protein JCM10914_321 [Paenibacillus sp. JCM 10914]